LAGPRIRALQAHMCHLVSVKYWATNVESS
jgi:hypothetical protein